MNKKENHISSNYSIKYFFGYLGYNKEIKIHGPNKMFEIGDDGNMMFYRNLLLDLL
jgi:hypothetical protein